MTKNSEDTMYRIYTEVDKLGIRPQFEAQIRKMDKQEKHKWKNVCETWEYAFNKVSNKN